jgi:uncharacterized membrane protein YkvA (DUF1232 family)
MPPPTPHADSESESGFDPRDDSLTPTPGVPAPAKAPERRVAAREPGAEAASGNASARDARPGWFVAQWRRFKLLGAMLRDSREKGHELSWGRVLIVALTLVYAISPIDLIPDVLFPLGILDDAGAMAICLRVIHGALIAYATRKGINLDRYRLKRSQPGRREPGELRD